MPGIKVIHTMTFFYSLHSYANMQVNCHNGRLLCFHVKKNHFKIRLANFLVELYCNIEKKTHPQNLTSFVQDATELCRHATYLY